MHCVASNTMAFEHRRLNGWGDFNIDYSCKSVFSKHVMCEIYSGTFLLIQCSANEPKKLYLVMAVDADTVLVNLLKKPSEIPQQTVIPAFASDALSGVFEAVQTMDLCSFVLDQQHDVEVAFVFSTDEIESGLRNCRRISNAYCCRYQFNGVEVETLRHGIPRFPAKAMHYRHAHHHEYGTASIPSKNYSPASSTGTLTDKEKEPIIISRYNLRLNSGTTSSDAHPL